jgi:hypothetical protein
MRSIRPLLAAACTGALVFTGCGQSADRATVRSTAERFLNAYKADEGATACAALSQETRKALESQEQKPCAEAIGDVKLEPGAVKRVQVMLTNAKIDLAGGESVFLSEQAAGWRISALGCRPQGKPTNSPMDCELEA